MAHRIYKSWKLSQKESSIRKICLVKMINAARIRALAFALWKGCKCRNPKQGNLNFLDYEKLKKNSEFIGKDLSFSHFVPGEMKRNSSFSQLGKNEVKRNSSFHCQPHEDFQNFEQGFLHGKKKSVERLRLEQKTKELEECTFRPEITEFSQRFSPVYSKFNPAHLKEKEELYRQQKSQKELEGCTFQPKTNTHKALSLDRSFEKLYKDAEVHRQKMRSKELVEKDKEIANCTFKPTVLNPSKSNAGNVYEKLYKSYQESQREKRRLQMEKEAKEIEESTFTPKLITPKKECDDQVTVFERLYSQVEKKKEKLKKQEEEEVKARPSSVARSKRSSEDPPRFESLYALHKESSQKKLALQEKLLKESGALFKPDTSKSSLSKRSQESPLKVK